MMLSWVLLAIFSLGFTPVVPFQALIRTILWGSLGTWLAWSIHSPRHHSTNTEWTSIVMWMLENLRTQRQAKCNPCSQGSSLSKRKERAKKIINEQQDTRGCRSRGDTHWFHQGKGTYKALAPVNKLQPLSFKLTFFLILCGAEAGKPTFLLCQVVAALALKMGCPGKPAKLEEGERTCSCLLGHHWFSLSFLFLSASSQPGSCTLAGCSRTSNKIQLLDSPRLTELAWLYPLRDTSPSWPPHPLLRVQRLYPSWASHSDSCVYLGLAGLLLQAFKC